MKKISSYLLLLVLLVVAQACSDEDADPNQEVRDLIQQQDNQIKNYLSEQGIEAEKDEFGVYWVALQENASGREIQEGDVADVTYRLTQLDGTLIGENTGDSVRLAYDSQAGSYLPFYLLNALPGMKEGEKYRFYMPFNAAYGSYELPEVIPYRSIVVMDLEAKKVYKTVAEIKEGDIQMIESVLSAQELDADTLGASGVRKILVEEVESDQVPDAKDIVSIRYTGKLLDGEVFDKNTGASDELFTFTIGAGQVISGMEAGVKSMKLGEKATFYIPSTEAYGKSKSWYLIPEAVRQDFKIREGGKYRPYVAIPPHSPLVFEVELVDLVKKE